MVLQKTVALLVLLSLLHESRAFKHFLKNRLYGAHSQLSLKKYPENGPVKEFFFSQKLDHFNSSNTQTWQQRYQVNTEFYVDKNGPFFVMIDCEGEGLDGYGVLPGNWLMYGQMYQNAKKHNAALFILEHRFYGKSIPNKDVSKENLRYLSSVQALADVDYFIKFIKGHYGVPDARVVVFGGSYAGNLVVWFRELYPDATVGGVASSAPVLSKENYFEYLETVGYAMKITDPKCYDTVADAFRVIQDWVSAENDTAINSLFKLCTPLNYSDPYEPQIFYDYLRGGWIWAAQYTTVGSDSMLSNYCRIMTDEDLGSPVERYSIWYAYSTDTCVGTRYEDEVAAMRQESMDADYVVEGVRQWYWQACNEFGYFETADSENQPFGVGTRTLKYIEDIWCIMPFGMTREDIIAGIAASNDRYGGKSPNATKVFLFNGSFDPWHPLGIFEHDLNDQAPSRYIEGVSHCYDMREAQPTDPPALTKAREEMAAALTTWLLGEDLTTTPKSAGMALTAKVYLMAAAMVLIVGI